MLKITGKELKEAIRSADANLTNQKGYVDTLNVFPVPDGDTGTNMSMTLNNGTANVLKCDSDELGQVARALSKGLLMGARGNSGVITSQIFRGIYQYVENMSECNVLDLAKAFDNGTKVAYKAIMKPVEGTILTVVRESTFYTLEYVEAHPETTVEEFFKVLCEQAEDSLNFTPELLPVLKEVGVVDSGGYGLLTIFKGMKAYFDGTPVEYDNTVKESGSLAAEDLENDEFGYCTEFILRLSEDYMEKFNEDKLKKRLSEIGESLVVVRDEELVKVHVHTLTPGEALNIGQRYGEFIKLKIENMQEQHSNLSGGTKAPAEEVKAEPKEMGAIAVSVGEGMNNLFKDLGVDEIISGGQTMNPSTEDFCAVIKKMNCKNVIILPNNSNIILAASQAKDIMDDVHIEVVQTKSMQEGLSAMTVYDSSLSASDNAAAMAETAAGLVTASVTYAIKDTSYEGIEVKEGDFISMTGKKIVAADKDRLTSVKGLIDKLAENTDKDMLTIYVGDEGSEEEAGLIEEYVSETTDFMTDIVVTNQPVYSYLFGLE